MPTRSTRSTTQREDGRGHWPAGKRRHVVGRADLARMRQWFRRHALSQGGAGSNVGPTRKQAARETGISLRAIRRWETGEDMPSPDRLTTLLAWMDEHT